MNKRDKDRLLANFIGSVTEISIRNHPDFYQWSFPFCNGYYPSLDTMKFDKSWDWLIPVYSKWVHEIWHGSYSYIPDRIIEFTILIMDEKIEEAYEYMITEIKKLKDGKNTTI